MKRRQWLAHCSVLLLAGAMPVASRAQGTSAASAPQASLSKPLSKPLTKTPSKTSPPTIVVVGDSLSAEYGLQRGTGWVALMEKRLAQQRISATVVNASISGDTTSGGKTRLPSLLAQHHPAIVILELGGNDALRGLPLSLTQANLDDMVRSAKAAGAKVVVVGMQVPPNYGRKYGDDFAALFATVAKAGGAALVPFLLKGVADGPQADIIFQPDRIHPKEAAHPVMLENVWTVLRPLLK